MRSNTKTLAGLLVACCVPALPAHAGFVIAVEGDAGNYVVNAESYLLDDTGSTATVERLLRGPDLDQGFQLHVENNADPDIRFDFDFGGPNNQPLAVGMFAGAQGYAGYDPAAPLLSVAGLGHGCNGGSGEYNIKEVTESSDRSTLLQLAIDLAFYCESLGAPMHASIRLNSDLPLWDGEPDTRAGDDQIVAPAAFVQLDGSASTSIDGSPLSYQWTQTRGTAVVLSDPTAPAPTFISPGPVAREYQFLDFELATTDTSMRSSSDTVTITVSESPTQQTLFNSDYEDGIYFLPARTINGPLDPASISWGYGWDWYPSNIWMSYVATPDDPVPERIDFGMGLLEHYPHQFGEGIFYDSSHAFDGSEFATFSFGENHYYCTQSRGHFVVRDAAFEPNGVIKRLAVDFNIYCEDALWGPAEQTGVFRYNSVVPVTSRSPTAAPGRDRRVYSGDVINLDASSSYSGETPIASYAWQQTAGQSVSLTADDSVATSFIAPPVAAGTGSMAFDLTVTNDGGYSDTNTVNVTVLGPDDPKNYARLFADPNAYDFVLWGQDRYFNDDNAIFSAELDDPANPGKILRLWMHNYVEGYWNIDLATAFDQPLTPGVYREASNNPDENTRPYFRITGNSRTCGDALGEFIVHEFEQQADGTIDKLALDFTFMCTSQSPNTVTTGIVRYHSTIPDVAPDPIAAISGDATVTTGTNVILDSSGSYPGAAGIATTEWQQTGGPAVAVTDPHAPTLSFTPDLAGTAPVPLQFQVTITTNDGRVSTDTYTVTVIPDGVPFSAIEIFSEPGDFIGQGQYSYLDVDDVEFFVPINYDHRAYFSVNGTESWDFEFKAPFDAVLTPGNYESAFKVSGPPSFPGLAVYGHYRGCNTVQGRFVVHEIRWNPDGTLDALAVDFLQHCDYREPKSWGALRYNSTVPLRPPVPNAAAGQDLVLPEQTTVQLDGTNSYDADGQIVSYAWSQLSGPAVTLDNPNSPAPTFVAPDVPPGTAAIEFELTVTDSDGNSNADVVTITVLDETDPRNLLGIHLLPGWRANYGDLSFSDNNAYFFSSSNPLPNQLDVSIYSYWNYGFTFVGPNNTLVKAGQHYTQTQASRDAGGAYMNMILESLSFVGTGWFDILELQKPGDELLSIAADYKVQPVDWLDPIVGSVRFNSAIPPRTSFVAAFANGAATLGEGSSVVLNGLGSYATESNIVGYRWRVTDGPQVVFSGDTATPSFVAPAIPDTGLPVTMTIELEVEDDAGTIDTDEMVIDIRDNNVTGFPDDMLTMRATNSTPLGVTVDGGDLVYNESLVVLPGTDLEPDPRQQIPFGVWILHVLAPSGLATLNLHAADNGFPEGTRWMANWPSVGYQEFQGTQEISVDRKTLLIELVDGGADDQDGVVNGTVEIRGAASVFPPPVPPPPPQYVPPPKSGGGGGGGGSTSPLLLLFLVAVRSRQALSARQRSTFFSGAR